jgi:ribosomal protein S18 acetylase RimI-like enzyme
MIHPQHDDVAAAIRAAYSEPYPDMGWMTERRRFGIYRRNVKAATYPSVLVRGVTPAELPTFLADVRAYYGAGPRPARIVIEERALDATLGPALEAAGLPLDERSAFLAHVGDVADAGEVAGLSVEAVADAGLTEYEDARCRGFANSDEPTPPEELAWRIDLRRAEAEGGAHYWLARVGGEAAGCMSWYKGEDRMVFSLATRVPFRRRGIASHLLCRLLADAQEAGTRAVIISADEADHPIEIYRRLGFTDEVYWRATYELDLR